MSILQLLNTPRMKAIAVFLAVFILGGGTGYVAGFWRGTTSPWHGQGGPWYGAVTSASGPEETLLRKLENDLKLSPSQRTRASEILRRHHQRLAQLGREATPRVEAILEDARRELRSLMDPRQRECFDQMVQSSMKRRGAPQERGRGFGAGGTPR